MKKTLIASLLIGIAIGGYFGYTKLAGANPAFFVVGTPTGTASSTAQTTATFAFQRVGTGTSTPSLNNNSGTALAVDSAQLLVQWVGSSTASSLQIRIECSYDNIDWYQSCSGGLATTTIYTLNYASSTGIGGAGLNERPTTAFSGVAGQVNARTLVVDTPLRYTRAIIATPPGSLNNTVWAQFIGKRENQ